VNWSLSPPVGTVTNGVYTAPAVISLQQTVTVSAASAADPTKIAKASVTLVPSVSVSVSPTSVSLTPSQSQQFSASLSGTTNPNVTWSMSPSVGSLGNGLYQAPATISSQQTVTVTATSLADSTKTGSATITLVPTVGIALTPSSISLTGGQSTQFNVTSAGAPASASSVTWTLAPLVGNITNGVYTAPVTISSLQTIVLTVASIANPTQTATANITLTASTAPATSVSPSLASLSPSGTQQFTATGLGTNPTWTISPNTGSITSGGLYSAPSSVTTQTTVTVTAANATNSAQTASATVTLNPAASQTPPPTTITLPLEVIGPNGTTVSTSFNIPSGTNLSGLNLWMKIHGLRSETQASVQLNSGGWQPINESNVTLLGLASAYGGIGGGFHTLEMTMPATALTTGANTLSFRFNQTDGRVSAFRVLEFNIQDANGNSLIPSSTFVYDDPNTWQPPSPNLSDIAAGQTLYRTASLTVPSSIGSSPIKAHCMDCHTQDGRDLKYFNYSNLSISNRSVFHGLTVAQGNQIASYIRSLTTPNPGRPWNPPYQPGPGLDSQPVTQWAAGAGVDATLASDADMMNTLFPSGVQAGFFSPTNVLSVRETPVAVQLPDWNSWLPMTHPMDAWSDFATSPFYNRYLIIRSLLVPDSPTAYTNAYPDFMTWGGERQAFLGSKIALNASASSTYLKNIYSTMLWVMVKSWELNQEFQLEGMAKTVYPYPKAEPRAWLSSYPFQTSPNMLHISLSSGALDNGNISTVTYLAFIWYQLQLIVNNSEYQQQGNTPIDWQYTFAFIKDLGAYSPPQAALLNLWLTKGIQISDNGIGPDQYGVGWNWWVNDISREVSPGFSSLWTGTTPGTRSAILNGIVQAFVTEVSQFTPAQFVAGGYTTTRLPVHGEPDSVNFEDRVWYMIPQFRYFGVSQTLVNQLAAWAQSVWPLGDWAATTTATCVPFPGRPEGAQCSTEH
jgi:hypothetical protein